METGPHDVRSRELPVVREQYGFQRTRCACDLCRAPCRHLPGSLDIDDLWGLCPPGRDLFHWAEEHLRAVIDKQYPTLVPARLNSGSCHWLFDGQCAVHANAPYSCAFFDMHMTAKEVRRRSAATIQARQQDAARNGLYHRVWVHLRRKQLIALSADRTALADELRQITAKGGGTLCEGSLLL
jgi:hypothetical protein